MPLARSSRHLRRRRKQAAAASSAPAAPQYPAEALVDPPGIVAQAVMAGFRVDFIDGTKLLEGPFHYNAGLIERDDGLWLAYRDQNRREDPGCGTSRIGVCRLDGDMLEPGPSVVLDLPSHFEGPLTEQCEDPRLFRHGSDVWMSYVAYDRIGTCGQALVRLDRDWKVAEEVRIDYGGNFQKTKWQKNWAIFSDGLNGWGKTMRMVYMPDPHEVVDLKSGEDAELISRERGVAWPWGQVRGGTPPVLKDGLYWSFIHSRLMCPPGRFRYFMGAYAFGPRPPYRPEVVSSEPILSASRHDPERTRLPLVVFPCGAVLRGDEWWVSLGVNDHSTAIARIPHEWLRKRVRAC